MDFEIFGDIAQLKTLFKYKIKESGYEKTMTGLEVEGYGVLVNVTTKNGNNISEVLEFVAGVKIEDIYKEGKLVARKLVPFPIELQEVAEEPVVFEEQELLEQEPEPIVEAEQEPETPLYQ